MLDFGNEPGLKSKISAQKGGLNKSTAPDQTGYGAIQRVHLRPLNRTFPAPYFPGPPLSVETHCFGPLGQSVSLRRRYPAKKKCQTRASDGDGREGCPRGPENRGGHGLSRVCDGFPCAACNPLVMPRSAPLCRLRTEGPHAEILDFSRGSSPKFSTPIDLPWDRWAYSSPSCFAPYNPYVSKPVHFHRTGQCRQYKGWRHRSCRCKP